MRVEKHIKILLSILLLGLTVTSCSAGVEQTDGDDAEITANAKITLYTASMFGGTDSNADNYRRINERFMEENQNVIIEDNSQTVDQNWKNRIALDFTVGNEPDVIQFFTDATANDVLATDKFVTIDEIKAEYPEYAKDTLEEALEAAENPDGVRRAVPTIGYWEGLFCNKDLFDKYNLELPTDWDKMQDAISVFNENGIIPIAVSLENVPHYILEFLLLSASGEDVYSKIPENVPEEWIKALDMLRELREAGAFPKNTDTIDNEYASDLFIDKLAAMQVEGSWYLSGINDQENTVVIPFPNIPGGKASDGVIIGGISNGFYITKKAWENPQKREIAVKFVMAHTNVEAVTAYRGGSGLASVEVKPAAVMTDLEKSGLEYGNSASHIVTATDSRLMPEAYNKLIEGIVDISTGALEPKVLLEEVLKINKQ